MAVQFKDYYKILGVDTKAEMDIIKSAYRKLARKYHPDVNKGGVEKFREIQEAYDVLCDPAKRRQYDQVGAGYQAGMEFKVPGNFRPPPRKEPPRSGFSEFFETLFGGRNAAKQEARSTNSRSASPNSQPGKPGRPKGDVESEMKISLEEAHRGTQKKIQINIKRICPDCKGSGKKGSEALCPECRGQGARPQARSVEIKIAPGTRDGARLRLSGFGESGPGLDKPGDLYVRIAYLPHPIFRAEGAQIHVDLPVAPWEAVLGGEVEAPSLDGNVKMKLPPGTQNDVKLRLHQRGLKTENGRGDAIVHVKIVIPTEVTDRERHLFRQLRDVSHFRPRVRKRSVF